MYMLRTSILDLIRNIKKILSEKKELSIRAISYKTKSKWETTLKALEFMKEFNLVDERLGTETKRKERLFRLI